MRFFQEVATERAVFETFATEGLGFPSTTFGTISAFVAKYYAVAKDTFAAIVAQRAYIFGAIVTVITSRSAVTPL